MNYKQLKFGAFMCLAWGLILSILPSISTNISLGIMASIVLFSFAKAIEHKDEE